LEKSTNIYNHLKTCHKYYETNIYIAIIRNSEAEKSLSDMHRLPFAWLVFKNKEA